MAADIEWRPGSFTKNFSWGPSGSGLRQLYEMIRVGFDDEVDRVPRRVFRERVSKLNRPDYVAINFFLMNQLFENEEFILVDELVFKARNFEYDRSFDLLAIFVFNLSYVGNWKGSKPYQSQPALWARHYIIDRINDQMDWDTSIVSAKDIQSFVEGDKRYTAKTSRKLATNLNYLYKISGLLDSPSQHASLWWASALFLCLDRIVEHRKHSKQPVSDSNYELYLRKENFTGLSGGYSTEKDLAIRHLVSLYVACGGRERFSEEAVRMRQAALLPDIQHYANNPEAIGVIHPTNYRIQKTIPRACAMLAHSVGFEQYELEDLANFDASTYIRNRTRAALDWLKQKGIKPTMSAEQLLKLTREK